MEAPTTRKEPLDAAPQTEGRPDPVAPKLPFTVPPFLARHGAAIAIVSLLLLAGAGATFVALSSPGSAPVGAGTRISQSAPIPDTLSQFGLRPEDTDRDGLSDAVENYVYGSDPRNWNTSGLGIPDGWLAEFGHDPLSPATRNATGAAPPAAVVPAAYGDAWPAKLNVPLRAWYLAGRPEGFREGQDDAWWPGGRSLDPRKWDNSGSGIPTTWLLKHGLDPFDRGVGATPAPGGSGLTVNESYVHGTDPRAIDSDGDGLPDADELRKHRTDPAKFSTSGTGVADGWLVHYSLDPLSKDSASSDPDADGLTNLEEFLYSYDLLSGQVASRGLSVLYERGLDPSVSSTAGSGIPDGWFVKFGIDPFDPAEPDRVLQKASEYPQARFLRDAPEGKVPLEDLEMTVRDAYAHGRPASWREESDGVWWGGTNPAERDSDGDGLPDAVEIRGWYVNVTKAVGANARPEWVLVSSSPTNPDSDADGLSDAEEYAGRTSCGTRQATGPGAATAGTDRSFPPTDPRNKDTAFSGLTDREKVCGVVRGSIVYDFHGLKSKGGAGLDPTRADSAGDALKDGRKLDYWHARYLRYRTSAAYEFNGSAYASVFEWTRGHAEWGSRFTGLSDAEIVELFRPDRDVDNDGLVNLLDDDPSGGLLSGGKRDAFLGQGPQIDPALYSRTEFASDFALPATDPANPDTDGDGLPDYWEIKFCNSGTCRDPQRGGWKLDASLFDSDGDGTSDADENNDGDEVTWYAYTLRADGTRSRKANVVPFRNGDEYRAETDPNKVSTVDDDVPDGWKYFWGVTYPQLVGGEGNVGDLSPADRLGILEKARSGFIDVKANLRDAGAKRFDYVRFVNVSKPTAVECTRANAEPLVAALPEALRLRDAERLVERAGNPYCGQDFDGDPVTIVAIGGTHRVSIRDEVRFATNPYLADSDHDGAPDAWEAFHAVKRVGIFEPDPAADDGKADPDGDGLSNVVESCLLPSADFREEACVAAPAADRLGTDPHRRDTDQDGIDDGVERGRSNALDPSDVARFKDASKDLDRDGVADFQEVAGWGKEYYAKPVRTDPSGADSDADGLVDGPVQDLDPGDPAQAAAIDALRASGAAWSSLGSKVRFYGEVPLTNPCASDTGPDGVPDGWVGYYAFSGGLSPKGPDEVTEYLPAYRSGQPAWWKDPAFTPNPRTGACEGDPGHGVWWWGVPPDRVGVLTTDLDRDGLNDLNGEDPFPRASSLNVYRHGDVAIHDPDAVAPYVLAAPSREEALRRAQAFGDFPGNPIAGRVEAGARDANGNGVPDERDRARTEILDLAVTGLSEDAQNGGHVVEKGRTFTVSGRLVVNERDRSGNLVNGESGGSRVGIPGATVVVSALRPEVTTVVGAGFTDATGAFRIDVNITQSGAEDVPAGHVLLGKVRGKATWSLDPNAISTGLETRGVRNRLVVWTYNTTEALRPLELKAVLDGSVRRATAAAGTTGAPLNVTVVSPTLFHFDLKPAVNGRPLEGTARLLDASGAPVGDRLVTFEWTGVESGRATYSLTADGRVLRTAEDGSINLSAIQIPASVTEARDYVLTAEFSDPSDAFLRAARTSAAVRVRAPAGITLSFATPDVTVGAPLLVEGTLRTLRVTLLSGAVLPSAPLVGETVTVSVGGGGATFRTDTHGKFGGPLALPEDLGAGSQELRASFAGTPHVEATEERFPLSVKRTTSVAGLKSLEAPRNGQVAIRGSLLDNRGEGFEAYVTAYAGGQVIGRAPVGERGLFLVQGKLRGVPVGSHELRVTFDGTKDYAPSVGSARIKVYGTSELLVDSITAPAVRGRPLEVRGRLVDDAGDPIARQPVEFSWNGAFVAYAITDDAGAFARAFPVNASERIGPASLGLTYAPPETAVYRPASRTDTVRVVSAATLEFPERDVRRGDVAFTGRLTDDRGLAIAGALLRFEWGGKPAGSGITLRNGSFSVPFHVPSATAVGPVTVRASFAGNDRAAPAVIASAWRIVSPTTLHAAIAGEVVRGEVLELAGSLVEDNGRGVAGPVKVRIGDREIATLNVERGRFVARILLPSDLPRGPALLTLDHAGTPFLSPSKAQLSVLVKIRPRVEASLPRVAVEGFSFTGDVRLLDDHGEPLRNTTFIFVVGTDAPAVLASTDASGRAQLAATAPSRVGEALVGITVQGAEDVVPTRFDARSVRVVGVGGGAGLGLAAILLFLVALAGAGAGVYYGYRRRRLREVRGIVDEAIRELLAGNEYVGTIFLAYRRLAAHLARHGFLEKESDTPREFVAGVRRAVPVSGENLKRLIRLFEEARYSDHVVGPRERDEAVESLGKVRAELDGLLGERRAEREVAA